MVRISDMIRAEFAKGDDKRDAGLKVPEDIKRYDNIMYGEDAKWQLLDVYRPVDNDEKLPVIVSVHGGGWVYGDKERYQYYCMNLAQRGFAVVNFTYRLAPEYKFPAPLEDTNFVFEWILQNAENYGMDTDKICAVSDSAGAHILSLYLDMCVNSDYASNFNFNVPDGLHIRAVALNCGQYHMGEDELDELTGKLMEEYLENKGTEEELKLLCADDFVTAQFPPAFIMTSEEDFLRGQAPLMYNKLKSKNVTCELHDYKSTGETKLGHVFHLNIKSADAQKCNDEECAFFRSILEKGND